MPAKRKGAHHRGSYHVQSRRVRQAAWADPSTRCWRCGRTLAEVRATKPRARWTAGHLVDGQAGGPLLPECEPCNKGRGAAMGNRLRSNTRTPLTW